jgi:hypothetical protein
MSTDTLTPPNTNASDDIVIDVQADSLTGTGVRTAEAYRSLAESLSQSVMRVHVKVCRWRGHIQLQGATVEFNGVRLSAADGVKAQPYPLLPDTWKRRFTTLENTLRSAVRRRLLSGLSSGEGLIASVRDQVVKDVVGEDGKATSEILDEGVSDKRALCIETEFASALQAFRREGNKLSAVIRDCWDHGNLSVVILSTWFVPTKPN